MHQRRRRSARHSPSSASFSSSCFAASRLPSTRSTMSCAAAGSMSSRKRVGARIAASPAAPPAHRPDRHPDAVLLDRPHPGSIARLSVELVGDDEADHIGRRPRGELRQQRRSLVGLAARHAQLEQSPLGEQRQRLAGSRSSSQSNPAVDEEHCAVRDSPRARRRRAPHPRPRRPAAAHRRRPGRCGASLGRAPPATGRRSGATTAPSHVALTRAAPAPPGTRAPCDQ